MKTANTTQVLRVYVSAWLLTFIAVVWSGLSLAALRRLSKEDWKLVGPVEWLSVGLLLAQLLFICAAVAAWLKKKKEDLLVDSGRNQSFIGPFVLGYVLYFVSTWTSGWLSIVSALIGSASLVVATVLFFKEIRRQRQLLSAKSSRLSGDSRVNVEDA